MIFCLISKLKNRSWARQSSGALPIHIPKSGDIGYVRIRTYTYITKKSKKPTMRGTAGQVVIILLVTITVFFTNLGTPRLWDRDEPRNAGCAAEMLARNDWVVPIFNSQLRPHKPALLYWLMISAYSAFGVNEFSARFWSAALAVGTCLATYMIGRRLFDSVIGCVGAIALATSMMFVVAARAATPDSVLVFCSTLSLMFFVLGAFPKSNGDEADQSWQGFFPTNNWYVIAAYIAMGFGVLAKGPIGFLLPMAMIDMFGLSKTLAEREAAAEQATQQTSTSWLVRAGSFVAYFLRCFAPVHFAKTLWAMRPLTAAAIIVAISSPWFVWVHFRTEGDFTQLFFIGEHFVRATKAMENHSGGVWFYPLAILVGFFPWSCFWGPVVVGLFKPTDASPQGKRWRTATLFLLCWVGVQVGVFTIAKTKLASYVTPCYPALALLAASCLVDFARQLAKPDRVSPVRVEPFWFYAAFVGLGIGGVLISVGMWIGVGEYLPNVQWLAVLGLIPVAASVWLVWELSRQRSGRLVAIYCIGAVVLAITMFDFGAVVVDRQRSCMTVLSEAKTRSGPVATYGCHESTWVFYCQKPIVELHVETGPVQTFASGPPKEPASRKFWKKMPWQRLNQFIASNETPLIITSSDQADDLLKRLPDDFGLICDTDYFIAKSAEEKKLCLIGRVGE